MWRVKKRIIKRQKLKVAIKYIKMKNNKFTNIDWRNKKIRKEHLKGVSTAKLAKTFKLSIRSVQKIVSKVG